jgi:hypothetical protein
LVLVLVLRFGLCFGGFGLVYGFGLRLGYFFSVHREVFSSLALKSLAFLYEL